MLNRTVRIALILIVATLSLSAAGTRAGESPRITLASVGWTGVTVKTEMAAAILSSLGYRTKQITMSVPIVYVALSKGDADIFLGNWMPSMASIADKHFQDGSVIQYSTNMKGAKYTLAVPTYCADAGLRHFKDIVTFGEELDWKIYGIEAGNDGNMIIQSMIDKDMFGLGKFSLVSSSEVGMLLEVQSCTRRKKPIVFLGWSPHSMNERIDMTYLNGSTEETFGGSDGTAAVWTNTRKGLESDHPNVAVFLKNLVFPIAMMNQIMTDIHETTSLPPRTAGLNWLKAHPEQYATWLKGVTTLAGKPGAEAFEAYLAEHIR